VAVLPAAVAERFAKLFAITTRPLAEPWARRRYLLAAHQQEVLPTVVQRFVDTLVRLAAAEPESRTPATPASANP
jgi:hypothetical protein